MPSPERLGWWPSLRLLIWKELCELAESRAAWLLFAVSSVLVGHAFGDALQFYAEASGSGGGPAALSQSLSPLDGIVVPVFGAYDLVATLVFPFVVIRLFAAERATGELALSLQVPGRFWVVPTAKTVALYIAWMLSLLPAFIALGIWKADGGHLAAPETLTVIAGYLVRGLLTIGIGAAACSITGSGSSAAIITLTITLGGWMLDYAAAAKGGMIGVLSMYTPEAALRSAERGELRVVASVIPKTIGILGVVLWAGSVQTGRAMQWRARTAAVAFSVALAICVIGVMADHSWDTSEDRRNSFAEADERALSSVDGTLKVTVHLAAEDPRLHDLERGVLFKLLRTVRHLEVTYASKSRSGLFESSSSYGETWYELGDRRVVTRSVAEPVVLESLYELMKVTPPVAQSTTYPGYPARIESRIAPWLFFALIPLALAFFWWGLHNRRFDISPIPTA